VTAARPSSRELPLLPTLLCLLGAGAVSSLVATAVLNEGSNAFVLGNSPFALLAIDGLLTSLMGAVVIRPLLKSVVDCEVSYGAAFVALAGGSLVTIAFTWATSSAVQQSGNPGVIPTGGILFSFAPALLSTAVSYWLLQRAVRGRETAATGVEQPGDSSRVSGSWADDAPTRTSQETQWGFAGKSFDELVSAAREASLNLVDAASRADPADVPDLIIEGLPIIQAITEQLQDSTPPMAVPGRLNEQLTAGLNQLQEDLLDTARSAAQTAGNRATQRGWVLPRSVDVSDGGARYRWERSLSPGLKMVKEALAELNGLGVGTGW